MFGAGLSRGQYSTFSRQRTNEILSGAREGYGRRPAWLETETERGCDHCVVQLEESLRGVTLELPKSRKTCPSRPQMLGHCG